MSKALQNVGPVNANTTYVAGDLVARNTTIKLPEVTYKTATITTAGGDLEIPLYGLTDSLEATIQKIGVDKGLSKLLTMESKTFEFRWAQQVTETDGSTNVQGCKAFIRGIPKKGMPALEAKPGDAMELEIPLTVTRYQLFVDGSEVILIDKLTGQVRINGKDFSKEITSLL